MKSFTASVGAFAALTLSGLTSLASAVTIAEINSNKFVSPFNGQNLTDIEGLVTAKGPNGIFIRSTTPDADPATSESIYVFNQALSRNATIRTGDVIRLDGRMVEFRATSNPTYILLAEIERPTNVRVISSGNAVTPRIIGKDTTAPPTEQYSSLDGGDVFRVPNDASRVSVANPTLEPSKYGLDFWESLSGELITVKGAFAASRPVNNFGDTWVAGDWKITGRNKRGGITMTDKDANPETIIIGTPLDGTSNPNGTRLGDTLEDITGIVTYAFGFYRILPTTALKITGSATPAIAPSTTLTSDKRCGGLTFGSYNVENLTPTKPILPAIASHIAHVLKTPDFLFLQEIQDNDGAVGGTSSPVVSANLTLTALTDSIRAQSGVQYAFTNIDPVDDQDGGEPGGNIRTAYLYNPSILRLRNPNPGNSTASVSVVRTYTGPTLNLNPGRIDPLNPAFQASRKPLVAQWETLDGRNTFFTVNVHFGSKGGSSSLHGDARPPINGGVADRTLQAQITADFIKQILNADPTASVIAAGDFNEFAFVDPLRQFVSRSGMRDLDVEANLPVLERYTYLFDMNSQQLDHMYVSPALAAKKYIGRVKYEHIHINTWDTRDGQISDHDPSVAKLDTCRLLW